MGNVFDVGHDVARLGQLLFDDGDTTGGASLAYRMQDDEDKRIAQTYAEELRSGLNSLGVKFQNKDVFARSFKVPVDTYDNPYALRGVYDESKSQTVNAFMGRGDVAAFFKRRPEFQYEILKVSNDEKYSMKISSESQFVDGKNMFKSKVTGPVSVEEQVEIMSTGSGEFGTKTYGKAASKPRFIDDIARDAMLLEIMSPEEIANMDNPTVVNAISNLQVETELIDAMNTSIQYNVDTAETYNKMATERLETLAKAGQQGETILRTMPRFNQVQFDEAQDAIRQNVVGNVTKLGTGLVTAYSNLMREKITEANVFLTKQFDPNNPEQALERQSFIEQLAITKQLVVDGLNTFKQNLLLNFGTLDKVFPKETFTTFVGNVLDKEIQAQETQWNNLIGTVEKAKGGSTEREVVLGNVKYDADLLQAKTMVRLGLLELNFMEDIDYPTYRMYRDAQMFKDIIPLIVAGLTFETPSLSKSLGNLHVTKDTALKMTHYRSFVDLSDKAFGVSSGADVARELLMQPAGSKAKNQYAIVTKNMTDDLSAYANIKSDPTQAKFKANVIEQLFAGYAMLETHRKANKQLYAANGPFATLGQVLDKTATILIGENPKIKDQADLDKLIQTMTRLTSEVSSSKASLEARDIVSKGLQVTFGDNESKSVLGSLGDLVPDLDKRFTDLLLPPVDKETPVKK